MPQNRRVILEELSESRICSRQRVRLNGNGISRSRRFRDLVCRAGSSSVSCYKPYSKLTGANYFFYYGTVVSNGAGIRDTYVTQMIVGGVSLGTTFGGLYVIEHYGRRKLLITRGVWMFVCFMGFATVGNFS